MGIFCLDWNFEGLLQLLLRPQAKVVVISDIGRLELLGGTVG